MEREKQNLEVAGQIVIAENFSAFDKATAHIYLEDISRSDAESIIVEETVVENIKHNERETKIPFRLKIADENVINPQNFYSVRLWIDIDGDGRESAADLYSDRSYRVLTRGFGNSVKIKIGF